MFLLFDDEIRILVPQPESHPGCARHRYDGRAAWLVNDDVLAADALAAAGVVMHIVDDAMPGVPVARLRPVAPAATATTPAEAPRTEITTAADVEAPPVQTEARAEMTGPIADRIRSAFPAGNRPRVFAGGEAPTDGVFTVMYGSLPPTVQPGTWYRLRIVGDHMLEAGDPWVLVRATADEPAGAVDGDIAFAWIADNVIWLPVAVNVRDPASPTASENEALAVLYRLVQKLPGAARRRTGPVRHPEVRVARPGTITAPGGLVDPAPNGQPDLRGALEAEIRVRQGGGIGELERNRANLQNQLGMAFAQEFDAVRKRTFAAVGTTREDDLSQRIQRVSRRPDVLDVRVNSGELVIDIADRCVVLPELSRGLGRYTLTLDPSTATIGFGPTGRSRSQIARAVLTLRSLEGLVEPLANGRIDEAVDVILSCLSTSDEAVAA